MPVLKRHIPCMRRARTSHANETCCILREGVPRVYHERFGTVFSWQAFARILPQNRIFKETNMITMLVTLPLFLSIVGAQESNRKR